jgi:tRNA 2-thiouridine synthesizing protein A
MLDLIAETCPMTFIKTRIALHELSKGDTLEVLLCGEEALKNVPRAIEEDGDKVLSIECLNGEIRKIIIERG